MIGRPGSFGDRMTLRLILALLVGLAAALKPHRKKLRHLFRKLVHLRLWGDVNDDRFLRGEVGDSEGGGGRVGGKHSSGDITERSGDDLVGSYLGAICATVAACTELIAGLNLRKRGRLRVGKLN